MARHGVWWWELDPSYYLILALERLGLVWDVKKTSRRPRGSRGPDISLASAQLVAAGAGRSG
jgi:hypothetical protein